VAKTWMKSDGCVPNAVIGQLGQIGKKGGNRKKKNRRRKNKTKLK